MEQRLEHPLTVLVVDDFEEMRSTLRLWLSKRGYRVVEADNGDTAIAVAARERPDVILMDIGMPERSGISATYKIRALPELHDVPIIAVTAYEAADLHQDALRAGCVECLIKPVDMERLQRILDGLSM